MLVEGAMDEAVAIRIVEAAGHSPGTVYGKKGSGYIKANILKFNQGCQGAFYLLALVDFMDTQLSCPPEVLSHWLPRRSRNMFLRLAVRELESWLLADRNNLADFLNIHLPHVPPNPEQISDPKQTVVDLARRSRSSRTRAALAPEGRSTAQVGKLYVSEMINFIKFHWDVQSARGNAPSLDRCLRRLEALRLA